jgi:hypothetical protein
MIIIFTNMSIVPLDAKRGAAERGIALSMRQVALPIMVCAP